MNWMETLRTGAGAIVSHRLRSILTVLGILIGIAAVILTVGLGEGAQSKVNSAIESLGTNLLVVSPGSTTSGAVRGGLGSSNTLTLADAERARITPRRAGHRRRCAHRPNGRCR